jgi:hypothetical protein
MTEEDIYEMISEAGMHVSNFDRFIGRVWCSDEYPIDEELFRFANLVAAHSREEANKQSQAEITHLKEQLMRANTHDGAYKAAFLAGQMAARGGK